MAITGRAPSDLPAKVAEEALGIKLRGRRRALVAMATHWLNNTLSGLGRPAVARAGLRGVPAIGATWLLYLGGSNTLFASVGVLPPPWRRDPGQLAIELIHAGAYAVAASTVYDLLDRPSGPE